MASAILGLRKFLGPPALAAALLGLTTCHPGPPSKPPPTLTKPPCQATLTTDVVTDEGIDTRTGCMIINMALGSATGSTDLTVAALMVRNEGNVPPAGLYPTPWFCTVVCRGVD